MNIDNIKPLLLCEVTIMLDAKVCTEKKEHGTTRYMPTDRRSN